MTKPAKINHATYLQGLALFTVAHKHYQKAREMESELCALLGYDDENYADCISDEIYDGGNFDRALKREEIKVEPKRAKKR